MLLFPLTSGCFIYRSLRKHETKQVKSFSALHQVTLYGYQHCQCVQSHADFHPWGIMKMAPPWAPRRLQSTKSQHSTVIDFHLKQQCCFSTGLWSTSCCGAHLSKYSVSTRYSALLAWLKLVWAEIWAEKWFVFKRKYTICVVVTSFIKDYAGNNRIEFEKDALF